MSTDKTAAIRQLEREVELLRDKYRTEQSHHAATERHNAKLSNELEEMQRLYQVAVRERAEALRYLEQVRDLLRSSLKDQTAILKSSKAFDELRTADYTTIDPELKRV